jgi:hypothetical protein
MHRRRLLATSVATGIAAAVFGGTAKAASKSVDIAVEKLFPYLKDYYGLPVSERSLFRMAYFAQVTQVRPEDFSLKLVHKGQTQALSLGKEGLISPLPSLQALTDKAVIAMSAPEETKVSFSIRLELMPALTPEARMDVAPLKQALVQASKSVKKAAGLMAMAMPTYDSLLITGVSAGEVILPDGSRKPLPLRPAFTSKRGNAIPATPYFSPASWPQATALQFAAKPDFLLIVPTPKA